MKQNIIIILAVMVLSSADACSAADWIDPCDLEQAGTYRLARQTPLMPDPDPADPMEALSRMKQIPAGLSIIVMSTRKVKWPAWYQVNVVSAREIIATGWVNCTALVGQDLTKLD